MSFILLAPLFLAGLAALVVPVVVHLIHRTKHEAVPFPSLMFVQRIPFKDIRRQRLRHKVLFALRSLAFILLALAFTRPFVDTDAEAAAFVAGGRDVVILVDASHSMRQGGRWQQAVNAAEAAIDALQPGDRGTLIFFADEADAVRPPDGDPNVLRAALASRVPGDGATHVSPALQLAGRLLAETDLPSREVVMISDFQRSAWDGVADVRLPPGTELYPVNVSRGDVGNVSVAFVALEHEVGDGPLRLSVSARIVNDGADPVEGLPVALSLNGQEVQRRTITLPAHGTEAVAFASVLIPAGTSRGVVTAGADDLPQDNEQSFIVRSNDALGALILESSNARNNQSLFLNRALSIGDRPRFAVRTRRLDQFRLSDLDGQAVVVLNDAPLPGGAAGRGILDFVRDGGGLLVALGEYNSTATWPAEGADLLPGTVGNRIDRADRPVGLASLEYGHPIFEVFATPRSGDFTFARFFRYRALEVANPRAILARFSDGAVAMAEQTVGEGRVVVWTSTFDTYWNDLALQPVFLPVVHRVARHLADYVEAQASFDVGDMLSIDASSADPAIRDLVASGEDLVLESPSGTRRVVRSSQPERTLVLPERGFYELRLLDGGNLPPAAVAANIDATESNLAGLDLEVFLAAARPNTAAGTALTAGRVLTTEERERRQSLWWYLLLAAMLILVVETVLSNRLSLVAR